MKMISTLVILTAAALADASPSAYQWHHKSHPAVFVTIILITPILCVTAQARKMGKEVENSIYYG